MSYILDPQQNNAPGILNGFFGPGVAGPLLPSAPQQAPVQVAQNGAPQPIAGPQSLWDRFQYNFAPEDYARRIAPQVMQQTYQALLAKTHGDQGAAYLMLTNPSLAAEYMKPEKLGPGDTLNAPLPLVGGNGGQGQNGALASNNKGLMGPDELGDMVNQRLLGDDTVENGRGKFSGPAGAVNYANYRTAKIQAMKAQGISPEELAQRTAKYPAFKEATKKLTDQATKMGAAGIEFKQLWPQYMADLEKYGTTKFPNANEFFQWMDKNKGNPDVATLLQRMTTLKNVYGSATNANAASGTTDYKFKEFAEALNPFWNMKQTQAIGDALTQEIDAARKSPLMEINRTAVDYGLGRSPTPKIISDANSRLQQGYTKEQIKENLATKGYNTKGIPAFDDEEKKSK